MSAALFPPIPRDDPPVSLGLRVAMIVLAILMLVTRLAATVISGISIGPVLCVSCILGLISLLVLPLLGILIPIIAANVAVARAGRRIADPASALGHGGPRVA